MNAVEEKRPPWRILLVIVLALGIGTVAQTYYSQAQRDEDNASSITRDSENSESIDALRERYEDSQQELNELIDRILAADTPEEINAALEEFSEQNPGVEPPVVLPPTTAGPTSRPTPTSAVPAPTTGAPGGGGAPAPPTRTTPPPAPPAQTSSVPAPTTTIPPILQLPGDDCLVNLLNICIG